MPRILHRIARWLTGNHPDTDTRHTPPTTYTDIDPYGHVLPPRPRKTHHRDTQHNGPATPERYDHR